jgi:hypothetical protein
MLAGNAGWLCYAGCQADIYAGRLAMLDVKAGCLCCLCWLARNDFYAYWQALLAKLTGNLTILAMLAKLVGWLCLLSWLAILVVLSVCLAMLVLLTGWLCYLARYDG